jgi:hypothetical protein
MKLAAVTAPGRLPTVVHDPGRWWRELATTGDHDLLRFSANEAWWRVVCSPHAPGAFLEALRPAARLRRRIEWRAQGIDLAHSGAAAASALVRLCRHETYRDAGTYIGVLAPLEAHLSALNAAQAEIRVSLDQGPYVPWVNYGSSRSLVDYARADTSLAALIRRAIESLPRDLDVLFINVTAPEDLLTAMIVARCWREAGGSGHVCLVDHGYENFSLRSHLGRLRESGSLLEMFDTVVERKDEEAAAVRDLVARLSRNERVKGFLRAAPVSGREHDDAEVPIPPPVPTFSPEPILWTRLSERRCYWSRCAFCVQNLKYDNPLPPARYEVEAALARIESALRAGYHNLIFSDEAIAPALLTDLCAGIEARGLRFRWACRCKLETAHTRELFERMRRAGCYEVLFGLESISPEVQKKMDKFVKGLDRERIRRILLALADTGIGVHLNLIAGFPGDSAGEVSDSVDFAIECLAHFNGATFTLNQFRLFPDTPVMEHPATFGVHPIVPAGDDMPSSYRYEVTPDLRDGHHAVLASIEGNRARLFQQLGWDPIMRAAGGSAAMALYFSSGHGAHMKTLARNPFANPPRAQRGAVVNG